MQISAIANWMYFENPQTNNRYYNVKFDKLHITVEPKGLYTDYLFDIEMHCLDNFKGNGEQIELYWNLYIDNSAFIDDAWLWVGDTLVNADIMDKWTANAIYEGVVNRRKEDPLLILKDNNYYKLKLYPFIENESRHFKFKIMFPNNISGTNVVSSFPFQNLLMSNNNIIHQSIQLDFVNNKLNKMPNKIDQHFDLKDSSIVDGKKVYSYQFNLKTKSAPTNLGFVYELQTKQNVFLGIEQTSNNDGYFQLVCDMNTLEIDDDSEVLFLLNYQAGKTSVHKQEVLNVFRNFINNYKSRNIKFNLLTSSGTETKNLGDGFLDIKDKSNIDSLFLARNIKLNDYSSLFLLLLDGVGYANKYSKNAKIILINCSDEFFSPATANSFIEDLNSINQSNLQINVIDYQTKAYNFDPANPNLNKGNYYLYNIITKRTGGSYQTYPSNSLFSQFVEQSIYDLINSLDYYEVKLKPSDGLAYHIFNYSLNSSSNPLKFDILLGKYVGKLPFEVEIVAIKDGKAYFKTLIFDKEEDLIEENASSQIWNYFYLRDMEQKIKPNDNTAIRKLVDLSMERRILTNYTAFLALEPWMKKQNDTIWNNDEKTTTDVELEETDKSFGKLSITTYPNPFSEIVSINIENISESEIIESAFIYDESGNQIFSFDLSSLFNSKFELIWKPNNIPSGFYLIKIKTNKRELIKKIIKI